MSTTDLLNLIWGKAYLEFNSEISGIIKSTFDYENCHCQTCEELLDEYQDKDGILAEFEILENKITVIIFPDYFNISSGHILDENYIYDRIEDLFEKQDHLNLSRIDIVHAELSESYEIA